MGAGMQGMQMGGAKAEEKIVIPTMCSGMVIGKGGTTISNIKMQSQTNITIADAAPSVIYIRVCSILHSVAYSSHAYSSHVSALHTMP
jgi:ribosomal protein S3